MPVRSLVGARAAVEPRARRLVGLVNRCHKHRRPLLGRIEQTVVVWLFVGQV